MSDYLTKPINPNILKEKLQHWLKVKELSNKKIEKQATTKHYKEITINNNHQVVTSKNNTIETVDVTNEITTKDSTISKVNKTKQFTVWDKAACLKRVSDNQALLKGLIGIFIEDTPKMIADLTYAI